MASMELLALSREDFLGALTEQEATTTEAPIGPQSARGAGESRRQRIEFLSGVNLVSHLDGASLSRLAAVSTVDRWPKGATIVRRGDHGDRFYVMLEGGAAVVVDGRRVGELRPGDQFGEIALLHDVPRQADVVTTDPALTLSIHRDDLLPEVRTRVVRG
jgi:CRP-like cAMP-binding protein